MRIIFMGTPDFAVPSLQSLINSGYEIAAVFSQPDKKVGRKQVLTPPPVKELAMKYDIPVYQPQSLKDEDILTIINELDVDLIVVAAYGKILPPHILYSVKYGCINVHASLLPKYRGAAPIQHAVLNGDSETGVCIMQMNEGLDTGDIILNKKTKIDINETSQLLFERLSLLGAESLIEALHNIESGAVSLQKQEGESSYASKIDKSFCPIDWNKTAFEIHNKIRGLQTWPVASTIVNGREIKIHKAILSDSIGKTAGEVVGNSGVLTVTCGDLKCIDILEVQAAGKKKTDIKSFLAGNRIEIGTILGD